ncbi:MAG: response regulator [Firmicutes bacterium]|nr:response regulator [Bacillota bacterium]
MKTIIVDDEAIMLRKFKRISEGIQDIELVGCFEDGASAIEYMAEHPVDLAFLDIEMPVMNGIDLAKKLRAMRSDILIVFLTAYDDYIRDCNEIGGDYYLIKPYSEETLELAMERLRLLRKRQQKEIYIQTFGRFLVMKEGEPIPLTGKAKEILALVVLKRGKEISNEELYRTVWEDRPCSNRDMTVLFNALRRLKKTLSNAGIADILITTKRGQKANTEIFDCDYYTWQDNERDERALFEGEFLTEYSWGESALAEIIEKINLGF